MSSLLQNIQESWEKPGILLGDDLPEKLEIDQLPSEQARIIKRILAHSDQQEIARLDQASAVGDYPLCFFDAESSNAFRMKARLKKQTLSEYLMWSLNLALDMIDIPQTPILFNVNNPQDGLSLNDEKLIVYDGGEISFDGQLSQSLFAYVPPLIPGRFLCSIFIWNKIISLSIQGDNDTKLTLLDAWQEKLLNF